MTNIFITLTINIPDDSTDKAYKIADVFEGWFLDGGGEQGFFDSLEDDDLVNSIENMSIRSKVGKD